MSASFKSLSESSGTRESVMLRRIRGKENDWAGATANPPFFGGCGEGSNG